jgi:hypothetical protein
MGSVFGNGKEESGKRAAEDIIIYMGKNVEIKGNVISKDRDGLTEESKEKLR